MADYYHGMTQEDVDKLIKEMQEEVDKLRNEFADYFGSLVTIWKVEIERCQELQSRLYKLRRTKFENKKD